MITIPAGSFLRGSSEFPDEGPVMQVAMDAFAIDSTPVTNSEFKDFIEAGGYKNPSFWLPQGWDYITLNKIEFPNYWFHSKLNQPDHPVTGVSWWEAMAYAAYVHKALPTEAQWEYACRGLDNRKYPWGDEEPTLEYANFAIDCDPFELDRSSTSVYAHPRNKSYFGCLDMAGNLAEWCLDNASTDYSYDKTGRNPVYLTRVEDYHIARGGCGLHNESYLRCSSRDNYPPSVRDNLIGFRCVVNEVPAS